MDIQTIHNTIFNIIKNSEIISHPDDYTDYVNGVKKTEGLKDKSEYIRNVHFTDNLEKLGIVITVQNPGEFNIIQNKYENAAIDIKVDVSELSNHTEGSSTLDIRDYEINKKTTEIINTLKLSKSNIFNSDIHNFRISQSINKSVNDLYQLNIFLEFDFFIS